MSHSRRRARTSARALSRAVLSYLRRKRYLRRSIPARDFAHFFQHGSNQP
jgi:hypothetical protein